LVGRGRQNNCLPLIIEPIRSFHGPRNFALLRRFALNALNREQTYKRSLRQKMKRTAMDNNYMVQVLNCFFISNTLDSSDSLCQA
jgi:SOS response regulatory protein OraA/RecX